uniref:Uncharacterized protein n=1 Tax=Candidatus Kentrum eta TaxID=2126337 RepID=A0A450VGW1_9GAMM|nr:MAG: hypothetical protein BECKH772B_GA0070898_103704 [Candidatus Kentron sp. H]VFK04034.1 MAG: hypothetical protein BECKH772A_GA0070896_103744 [Candidatus Kentron sp. H]VFK06573.1 MAG: hypothetical protein BECKH772C_GA0070978_103594 [Candidatus Kentron sp. H]
MKRLIHIFRSGEHRSEGGRPFDFPRPISPPPPGPMTPLATRRPLVKGHPGTDDPAYGWVARLLHGPDGLRMETRHVDPAFARQVDSRAFAKVSPSFYRPTDPNNPVPGVWYLRHVGFLGARPPAIKGLEDPSYAEGAGGEDGCVTFAEDLDLADTEPKAPPSPRTPHGEPTPMEKPP